MDACWNDAGFNSLSTARNTVQLPNGYRQIVSLYKALYTFITFLFKWSDYVQCSP